MGGVVLRSSYRMVNQDNVIQRCWWIRKVHVVQPWVGVVLQMNIVNVTNVSITEQVTFMKRSIHQYWMLLPNISCFSSWTTRHSASTKSTIIRTLIFSWFIIFLCCCLFLVPLFLWFSGPYFGLFLVPLSLRF